MRRSNTAGVSGVVQPGRKIERLFSGQFCCLLRLALTFIVIGWSCCAQTRIDLSSQSKRIDFSAADSTKPMKTGAALPATCAAGEVFLLLSAPAGSNLFTCLATNIWTVQNASIPQSTTAGTVLSAKPDGTFQWIAVPTAADLATKAALSHTHAGADITSGTIPAGRIQKVIGLTDLSDVSAKQGNGTTVVMSDTPTITTPVIPGYFTLTQTAAPAAPATGLLRVYGKTGAGICWKDSTNVETCAGTVGQSSSASALSVSANGSTVGSPRSTIDFVDGAGITSTISDTGAKITIQTAIAPSVQTKASDQTSSHLLCSAGSGNALTCSMSPTLATYTDKMLMNLCVTGAVTGATTLNIDTLGPKSVLNASGANLAAGDLGAGCSLITYYAASNSFRLPAGGSSAGPGLSTNASVPMNIGGCNTSASGVYTAWGVSGAGTFTCLGPGGMQAALTFPAGGTPQASYYFRLPQDWSVSGTTSYILRDVNYSGGSGSVKFDVAVACLPAGSSYLSPAFNTATSLTAPVGGAGAYADRVFQALSMTGCTAGDFAVVRVTRDNSVDGNPGTDDAVVNGELRYVRQ